MRKIIILSSIVLFSCNQTSMIEVDKENISEGIEGTIREIEKYKGGGYLLTIKSNKQFKNIGVYKTVGEVCKKNDYFKKIKNSNKCFLKRGDSLICLDCINIEKETRDALGQIEEWKSFEKNKWKITKTASH